MATLRGLLTKRNTASPIEENLERGYIWSWTPGTEYANFCNGICWTAPTAGAALIEIWGAGGSGSRMCCCGDGLPGNAGAYVKKTIQVQQGDTVTGCTGMSCNAHELCFSGCSNATGVCIITAANGNLCMCAEGGRGGTSFCNPDNLSMFCCFGANGFCATKCLNDRCGVICNHCSGGWCAFGYGGDVCCCGNVGCVSYFGCFPHCKCQFQRHVPTPAGMFSEEGAVITFNTESDGTPMSEWSGNQLFQFYAALNSTSRAPRMGTPNSYCWRSDRSCGCYEHQGCANYLPVGVGGLGPNPCPSVRDHGIRGGFGGVRIKFLAD